MKKMLCLVLVVLTMLALFTGCSGRFYSDYGGGNAGRTGGMFGNGNVSTSRDGTVNGGEWNGRNYRSGTGNGTMNGSTNANGTRKHGERMDIGAEVEIGR